MIKINAKYASIFELNADLTTEEKKVGSQALIRSDMVKKDLEKCLVEINSFYTTFKDTEDPFKDRAKLRAFKDKSVKNFNSFFEGSAFYLLECLEFFNTDTQTIKIINSFNSYTNELKDLINSFVYLFSDMHSEEFVTKCVGLLDSIKQKIKDILDMIDNRINKHIKENILSIDWRDEIADKLQRSIKDNVPILLELEKRNKQ